MGNNSNKPVILLFTPFYLPGFRGGGPIQTISNLVKGLSSEFEFHIVTSDRDLGDKESYPGVDVDVWGDVGGAKVFYASPKALSIFNVAKVMRQVDYDVLYLNSLFAVRFTLFPLLVAYAGVVSRKNIVLAPRGELSIGALAIKSLKKRLFIGLAKCFGLYRYCHWQASTDFEAADIKNMFRCSVDRISIAPNVVVPHEHAYDFETVAEDRSSCEEEVRTLRTCFLSRVSPMKNLDFALKVLAKVKVPVVFDVYGPTEDLAYWSVCLDLVKTLPDNIVFQYCGEVAHSDVTRVIGGYDLFFVPSRGENFGHVFVEAFSAGVPVLVSDRTPWRQLYSAGVGWDFSLDDLDKFVAAIEEAAGLSQECRYEMRRKCTGFVGDVLAANSGIKMNIEMFNAAMLCRCK